MQSSKTVAGVSALVRCPYAWSRQLAAIGVQIALRNVERQALLHTLCTYNSAFTTVRFYYPEIKVIVLMPVNKACTISVHMSQTARPIPKTPTDQQCFKAGQEAENA